MAIIIFMVVSRAIAISIVIINPRLPIYRFRRPQIQVDIETILNLRSLNFTWTKILEISRSTLNRRLEKEGISPNDRTQYSD